MTKGPRLWKDLADLDASLTATEADGSPAGALAALPSLSTQAGSKMATPVVVEHDEPPFFPVPSTERPSLLETTSSDSSIATVSSCTSEYSSTSSLDNAESFYGSYGAREHPYSTLFVRGAASTSSDRFPTFSPLSSTTAPSSRSNSFASSNSSDRGDALAAITEMPPASASSHRYSAPSANATPGSPLLPPTFPSVNRLSLDSLPSPGDSQVRSATLPSSAAFPPMAAGMARSRSAHQSPRPSSAGTTSTHSTSHSRGSFSSFGSGGMGGRASRRWVRDSDASSVCSGSSGRPKSTVGSPTAGPSTASVNDEENSEPGEVFKLSGEDDGEALEPRKEFAGATMKIDLDDATHIILTVVLPGFSLDNITVAMRRGHKVHIVADKYTEEGGHFEKLVSLGPDVSSAAPRAEFNGTELRVFVQRRPPRNLSRSNSRASSRSVTTPTSASTQVPDLAKVSHGKGEEAPIVTRSTNLGNAIKGAGPEAAKAAAKKAKEEAALRAKEQAKVLPKVGRAIAFKAALLGRSASTPTPPATSTASSPPAPPIPMVSVSLPTSSPIDLKEIDRELSSSSRLRLDTASPFPFSISPGPMSASSNASSSSFASSSYTSSSDSSLPSSPARPKIRPNDMNLTLRASDGSSFLQELAAQEKRDMELEAELEAGAGGEHRVELTTPKVERSGLVFSNS